jgi:preprotein translocase subunit SecD
MTRFALVLAILGMLAPATLGGGKKPPPMQVTFHLEGSQMEGPNLVFPQPTAGKTVYYRKSPEITIKDIVAFRAFATSDPNSYGVLLQLKPAAARRVQNIGNSNAGKYLLAVVNGQVRDAVLIDRPTTDPYIVIWQRVTPEELKVADMLMPQIGEDPKAWKERQKKRR